MSVLFATPCLSAKVEVDYFFAIHHTLNRLREANIGADVQFQTGVAFIDHARNILCHKFLHEFPNATDLFFIDDDVGWHSDAVISLLARPEDVVGGVYPLKQDEGGFPVDLMVDPLTQDLMERDGLFRVQFLPTGFMRIKRHVIEKMAEGQPTYPHHWANGTTDQISNIFRTGYANGRRWGEDVDFGNRWASLGGEMWLDPSFILSHVGRKRWADHYSRHIPGLREGLKKIREVTHQENRNEAPA